MSNYGNIRQKVPPWRIIINLPIGHITVAWALIQLK